MLPTIKMKKEMYEEAEQLKRVKKVDTYSLRSHCRSTTSVSATNVCPTCACDSETVNNLRRKHARSVFVLRQVSRILVPETMCDL
jgi:hypothetical protein